MISPVYYQGHIYAIQNDEIDLWHKSQEIDYQFRDTFEKRAFEAHDTRELDEFIDDLIQNYGIERAMYVLGRTVQFKEWDGRFSKAVKDSAAGLPRYPIDEHIPFDPCICDHVNPGLIDIIFKRFMNLKEFFHQVEENYINEENQDDMEHEV